MKKIKRLLDIGCGPRRPKNADEMFSDFEWTGIDKTDFSDRYDGDHFVQHDLKDPLPFPENYFNRIWCHHVLEHLPPMHPYVYIKPDEYKGPQDFLVYVFNEMWRVLKYRGRAHITVPWIEHNNARRSPTHYRFFVPEFFGCLTARSTPGNQAEWGHYGRWTGQAKIRDDTHIYVSLRAGQWDSREQAIRSIGRLKLPDWVTFAEDEK